MMSEKAKETTAALKELLGEYEAAEIERVLLAESLTGGEGNINTELLDEQPFLLAIMEAANDPQDDVVSYDCPVLRMFIRSVKLNMISNKRKGRLEIVQVMRGEEKEGGIKNRIKEAILGGDV